MTRLSYIQQILRQIYNGEPNDDSSITTNLVNQYLNQAIGIAAKQNYKEAIQLDGIGYVNNSFYSTFKDISIVADEDFLYRFTLPQVPVGIGRNEGVSNVKFKAEGRVSIDAVPLSIGQVGYASNMRPIPNKVLYYSQGSYIYILTSILLTEYKAIVTMISGGLSTDLSSTIHVPDDSFQVITEYIKAQLAFEKAQKQDLTNDGIDNN